MQNQIFKNFLKICIKTETSDQFGWEYSDQDTKIANAIQNALESIGVIAETPIGSIKKSIYCHLNENRDNATIVTQSDGHKYKDWDNRSVITWPILSTIPNNPVKTPAVKVSIERTAHVDEVEWKTSYRLIVEVTLTDENSNRLIMTMLTKETTSLDVIAKMLQRMSRGTNDENKKPCDPKQYSLDEFEELKRNVLSF